MFLVNFVGGFEAMPALLKHHRTYCSYADTIMPHFFFAVGFALRMTILRRIEREGAGKAYRQAVRRALGLILLGVVFYQLDESYRRWADLSSITPSEFAAKHLVRSVFQALVHIGITILWVLPVVGRSVRAQWLFLVGCGALHLALSRWFYLEWALAHRVIDGGPLGFLTWSLPTLSGSIACVWVAERQSVRAPSLLAAWGGSLIAAGYALSCQTAWKAGGSGWRAWLAAPPFFPPHGPLDVWTMSQQTGSVSYQLFGAGLSLAVYALFMVTCDRRRWESALFRTLGQNALAGYLIHLLVADAVGKFGPADAPLWYAAALFGLFFGITLVMMRALERQKLYLRL
jgi:hypothetical protein